MAENVEMLMLMLRESEQGVCAEQGARARSVFHARFAQVRFDAG
ncbi:MAG: hypothetical protein U1E56_14195 [Bauldia sp.]